MALYEAKEKRELKSKRAIKRFIGKHAFMSKCVGVDYRERGSPLIFYDGSNTPKLLDEFMCCGNIRTLFYQWYRLLSIKG